MMLRNGASPVPVPSRYRLRPWQQVVEKQRAGRLAADEDGVADLDVLKPRGQRPVGDLDAEEFEFSS